MRRASYKVQAEIPPFCALTPPKPSDIPHLALGDELQGAAADCNSAGETHAWFDSRVAHHPFILTWFRRDGGANAVPKRIQ